MRGFRFLIQWSAFIILLACSVQALSQNPDRVYGSKSREANRLVELAKENMENKDYGQALIMLNQALQYQSDHVDAYFNRALLKEKVMDPQGALTDYQIVLLLDTTYREAAFNRAKLRYRQGEYKRAITDFRKVLVMSSSETRMIYFKGTPLNGDASVPMQGISTSNNMEADIHNFIGLCYQALEDFEASVKAFDEALKLNPNDANFYVNRGLSQVSLGYTQKAIADFKSALVLAPEHAIAQFNLTQELESSGNLELAAYDEIIEQNPEFASAYVNRALAKINAGDLNGALKDYDHAVAADPRDPLIYLNRGLAREKSKNFRGALADYNKSIQLDPDAAKPYRSRGRVLFELEEFQLALEDLDQAIELAPSDGGSFFNRALVHKRLGNLRQTCSDLEQARALGIKMAIRAQQSYCNNAN